MLFPVWRSEMTRAGAVWLDVIPSLSGFSRAVESGTRAQLGQIGKASGAEWSSAFVGSAKSGMGSFKQSVKAEADAAARAVTDAAGKVEAARKREADAAGNVRVAEAKLAELRAKSNVPVSQMAAAEERLGRSRRSLDTASKGVLTGQRDLAVAEKAVGDSARSSSGWLQTAGVRVSQFGTSAQTGFGNAATAAGTWARVGGAALLGVAGLAGAGLVAAGSMGLKTAASLEQSQVAFSTLLGSGQKAQTFLGGLQKFAAATPFTLPGVVDASRQLLGVGASAKTVLPTLTAWGDTAGALGLSQDQFNRSMLAVTQSMAGGKIQAGDMLQITQAGIPIWSILAKSLGKPVAEVRNLSEHGKLLTKDVLPKLEAQMHKDYGGSMAKQSQTLSGLWSTFTDTLSIGLAKAILPLVPVLKHALPGAMALMGRGLSWVSRETALLIPKVREMWQWFDTRILPTLKRLGGAALAQVRAGLAEIGGAISRNRPQLQGMLTAFLKLAGLLAVSVGPAFRIVSGLISILIDYGARFWKLIVVVYGAMKIWTATQWLLNAALSANPIGLVIGLVAALALGLIYAYRHSDTFRRIVDGAFKVIAAAGKWMWENVLRPAFANLVGTFLAVAGAIVNGAARAFGWVPGIGGKLKVAAKTFNTFRDQVNASLAGVHDKTVTVTGKAIIDSNSKIYAAQGAKNFSKVHMAEGGRVPLVAGARYGMDSVPAVLMPDEYVIRADGSNLVDALRHFGAPGYAQGGLIPSARTSGAAQPGLMAQGVLNSIEAGVAGALKSGLSAAIAAAAASGAFGVGGSTAGPLGLQAVALARQYLGTPYLWGGMHPGGFDCSGLVDYIYSGLGHPLPRTASAMQAGLTQVPLGSAAIGDLLFFGGAAGRGGAHHVGFNLGGGMMLDAPTTGSFVRIESLRGWPDLSSAARPYDTGGMLQPGLQMVYNGTNKPEPVLTDRQWNLISDRQTAPAQGGDTAPVTFNFRETNMTPAHLIQVQYEVDLRRRIGRPS